MSGQYQIPFDKDGNQQHYPETSYDYSRSGYARRWECKWVDNFEFTDVLRYVEFRRGRSAAYAVFQRSDGTEVTMFLKELDELIKRRTIIGGAVSKSTYTFVKRGANYGVRLVSE